MYSFGKSIIKKINTVPQTCPTYSMKHIMCHTCLH